MGVKAKDLETASITTHNMLINDDNIDTRAADPEPQTALA
jgi:hypothetical protein